MILSEPVGLAMVIAPRGVGSSQSPASFLTWGTPFCGRGGRMRGPLRQAHVKGSKWVWCCSFVVTTASQDESNDKQRTYLAAGTFLPDFSLPQPHQPSVSSTSSHTRLVTCLVGGAQRRPKSLQVLTQHGCLLPHATTTEGHWACCGAPGVLVQLCHHLTV